MYVERIPNRNSPPAILLRESYRQGDKFKRRTLANLSDWPAAKIEAPVVPADQQALRLGRSLPHGHVAAALGMLRKLELATGALQIATPRIGTADQRRIAAVLETLHWR